MIDCCAGARGSTREPRERGGYKERTGRVESVSGAFAWHVVRVGMTMSTPLRLVGTRADSSTPSNTSPLVRAEHDQKFVVRNADRELERLLQQRPDLRERFTAMREEFSKSVDEAGKEFRSAGGRNYLNFAQNLARMRRELSASLREVVQQTPAPGTPPIGPDPTRPLPPGRIDVRA